MSTAAAGVHPDEQLAELRDRLWDALQSRDNKAKKQPNGSLSFRCVAHEDSSPSAWIRDFGWGCAGCGARGNLKDLAERIGVEAPWTGSSGYSVEDYASEKGFSLQNLTRWGAHTAEGKFSPFVAIPYRNPDGSPFRSRARGRNGRKWWHDDGVGISIYGLDFLTKAALDRPVVIVEGESDCHAAWTHKVLAVGIPGATTWRSEWAAHFAGRRVFIFQEPGEAGAQMVRAIAADLPDARIIGSGGLAKDLADLHRHDGAGFPAKLQAAMDAAQPLSESENFSHFSDFSRGAGPEEKKEEAPFWVEQPRPLTREVAAPNEFPVDALGDTLGNAARAIHEQVQAPLAICCQSVLATSTLAAQPHADIVLPTRQVKPLSGFYVSVAATGERKTTVDTLSNAPVREREAAMRESYAAELLAYDNEREAWEAQRRQVLSPKAKHSTVGAKRVALDALGPPPEPPLIPMLTADEPTFEGLAKLLAIGQPSVGVFSGEGGLFIGGHAMNQDNQLKTAAGLSGVWDGEPIRRVRAGDGSVVLPGRRVALHLMAQPDVATAMLSNPVLADQGLLSRILVTAPAPMAGARAWREPSAEGDAAIYAYHTRLRVLLNLPYSLVERKRNELEPRRLPLSPGASRLWIDYVGANEQRLAPGGPLEPVRGLGNKLPEHAARIAGVLTLVDDPHAAEVPEEKLEAGIAIADHYAAEALRLYATGQADPELRLAARLLGWLHTTWTEKLISLPDIYQRGLNAIGDAKTARRMVQILEDHNWLSKLHSPAEVNGVKRKDVWLIVRPEAAH